MFRTNLRNYIFLLSTLWIIACSHIGIQLNKEGTIPPPIPDCQRNCTREAGLASRPVYKTWVKYDHLDFKNGFDLAVETIRSQGHWILLTDPGSGTISTLMFLGTKQKGGYPATVRIVPEESSLVVHISLKATWGGLTSPNLCGFYDEFEKSVKQASSRAQIKKPVLSSQKLSKGVKEFPFSAPSPPLSSSPPSATAPKTSSPPLSQGNVVWVYVNLRERPGVQYKIIGRAYMMNSFAILAENPGWLQVRLENGAEGWMSKKATSDSLKTPSSQKPPASPPNSSKTRSSPRRLSPM